MSKLSLVLCSGSLLLAGALRRKSSKAKTGSPGRAFAMEAAQDTGGSSAIAGAELVMDTSYKYGKFEARTLFAGADGVISSFFLWKVDSWKDNFYWNELDFEKIGLENGECNLGLNLINGYPGPNSNEKHVGARPICSKFHDYSFEWTPDYVRFVVDGVELHRVTGWGLNEFNENAGAGMQFRFNVWPGDYRFGGNFNANNLPLYQYLDWARFSSYNGAGGFDLEWQEDFEGGSLPAGWSLGDWTSPLGYSDHRPSNVVFTGGMAVLALTPASQQPTNETVPPPPTPSPTPTPTPGRGGCCRFGGACGDCGDDGTGWCHISANNCAVCTGTFDSSAAAPSCSGAPSPPSPPSPTPSPSPPAGPGQCCYGGGCTSCNGAGEWCSSSASACGSCGGSYCSR